MREIINKRKERERHILNDDGSITAEIYDRDIFYLDKGKYKECDDTIVDSGKIFENKTNKIKTMFSKEEVRYALLLDNDYLIMKYIDNKPKVINHNKNMISYKGIQKDIDIEYELRNGNLKESIVINTIDSVKELNGFQFEIDTSLDIKVDNNCVLFYKDKTIIYKLPIPYMVDNNKNYNYNLKYSLSTNEKKKILTIDLDKEWLISSDRVYPVIVDPTIINAQGENCFDTYISSANPDSNLNISEKNRVSVYSDDINRTLIKFKLPEIDSSYSIVNASMRLYTSNSDIVLFLNPKAINVHAMNQDWDETNATWNNSNSNYDSHIEDSFYPAFDLDNNSNAETIVNLTKLVKRWYSGKPNYGVILKCNDETFNGDSYFYTSFSKTYDGIHETGLRPLLTISYRKQDGIQDYMDYKTIEYSHGATYINTYNGNVINNFSINKTIGSKLPVNLQLIHNSSNHLWKFNYEETLESEIIDNHDYLKYKDSTSATLYLIKVDDEYKDEDGFDYTIKNVNEKYQLIDSIGNIKEFDLINGIYRLTRIVDSAGNQLFINYVDNKIVSIIDSSSDELNITYNNDSIIVTSGYDNATIEKNDNEIRTITTKFGSVLLVYNEYQLLSKVTDVNGIYYTFDYFESSPHRISSIRNFGLNNTSGKNYSFVYDSDVTRIIDNKGRITVHIFDYYGRLVNKYMLLSDNSPFEDTYGICEDYNLSFDNSTNKKNKSTMPIKYVNNLLFNSRLEDDKEFNFIYKGYSTITDSISLEKELIFDPQVNNDNSIEFLIPKTGDYTISFEYKTFNGLGEAKLFKRVNNDEFLLNSEKMLVTNEFDKLGLNGNFNENDTLVLRVVPFNNQSEVLIKRLQIETGNVNNLYNMIDNSNFANGIEGWNVSGSLDSGDIIENPYEIVTLPSGEKALRLFGNPEGSSVLNQYFNLNGKEGDVYHISFWYKNEGLKESDGIEGNLINLQFFSIDPELGMGTHNIPLNYNIDEWQFFNGAYVAENDYEGFRFNIISGHESNSLYITDVMLTRDLSQFHYEYDEKGNLVKSSGLDNNTNVFKYDENNQLISSFNPKGNNFKYEYDNNVKSRVLKGISPTGISNEIKYDSYGNPIKTIINNVNPNKDIYNGGKYYIRLKGTDKYLKLKVDNSLIFETNECNIPFIYLETDELHGYTLRFNNKYLGINSDNQLELMDNSTNRIFFDLISNDNGSYSLKWMHDDIYLYVDSDDMLKAHIVEMNNMIIHEAEDNEMFYFEDVDTNLYIENSCTYTEDGKFINSFTDSLGYKTNYDINSKNGLIKNIINNKGFISKYEYDDHDRIIKVDYNDKNVNYLYNLNNNISKYISNNKEYDFNYDNYYRVKSVLLNDNILVNNEYEKNNGNLISTTYGNNQEIVYSYDNFDRLCCKKMNDKNYYFLYDNLGNLSKIESSTNDYHFYYDYANRLKKYIENNFLINLSYNGHGDLEQERFVFEDKEYIVDYSYDDNDMISEICLKDINLSYKYDNLGRIVEQNINNTFKTKYLYYSNGNKVSLILSEMLVGDKSFKYIYDELYNITHIYLNDKIVNEYVYDNHNQLICDYDYDDKSKTFYDYDHSGNIVSKRIYSFDDVLIENDTYSYMNKDWEDQLTKYNGDSISYDEIGNPLSFGKLKYKWSSGRKLLSFNDLENGILANYEYDFNGYRKQKNINGKITDYYYKDSHILFEKTNTDVLYFIYDNKCSIIGFIYNDSTYYYLKNYQNDIIGIMDNNYNQIVSYKYDSFGNVKRIVDYSNDNIGIVNPFRFRSYYYDNESGMYYLNSRYYNPKIGRFINSDNCLTDNMGSIYNNMYSYTNNNYINYLDYSGRFSVSLFICFAVATSIICVNTINGRRKAKSRISKVQEKNNKTIDYCPTNDSDFHDLLQKNANDVKEDTKNYNMGQKLVYFYNNVKTNSKYDLKNTDEYKGKTIFYNNLYMEAEDIGNYNYGYIGRALGIPTIVLIGGAGVYQLSSGTSELIDCISESICDDPRDTYFIKLGAKNYDDEN